MPRSTPCCPFGAIPRRPLARFAPIAGLIFLVGAAQAMASATPVATGLAPAAARPSDILQVFGRDLDRVVAVRLGNQAKIRELRVDPTGTAFTFVVPAQELPPGGAVLPVTVYYTSGVGNIHLRAVPAGLDLRILPAPPAAGGPVVTRLEPAEARPGDRIQLFGYHLDQVTKVRLGHHGKVRSLRATQGGTVLTCVLPAHGLPPDGAMARLQLLYHTGTHTRATAADQELRLLPEAVAARGPRPEVTGMAPAWGPAGTLVTLAGAHLDRVEQVHLGNRRVALVAQTPRPAHRLTFRIEGLLEPWTAIRATSAPVALTTAPVAGLGRQPGHRVLAGPFQVLPADGDGDPTAPEVPMMLSGVLFPGQGPGEHRFALMGFNLDPVYAAWVNDRPCALEGHPSHRIYDAMVDRRPRTEGGLPTTLTVLHRAAPGDPDLRAARITLAYRGGTLQKPEARYLTLVCPGGFGPDYRPVSEPGAGVPGEGPVAIHRLVPAQARPGEKVLLYGTGLDRVGRLHVGDFGAVEWFQSTPSGTCALAQLPQHWRPEAGAQVPLRFGAQLRPLTPSKARLLVLTGAGTAPAAPDAGALDLRLACMYVTQAVQSRDGQVPLVQGREAMLRAFLTADRDNQAQPRVRITVRDAAGRVRLERELTPYGAGVPTRIDENSLLRSCDFPLDRAFVEPGMTVQAQILDEAWAARPGSTLTVAPTVMAVPPVRISLVPVRLGGQVSKVEGDGRTLDSWLATVRKVLPVGQVEIRMGKAWDLQLEAKDIKSAMGDLVKELEARRTLADPWNLEYHVAVLPCAGDTYGLTHGHFGRTGSLGRSMVVLDRMDGDDPDRYHRTLAHELGHAFGLHHAPAGGAPGSDPRYPDPAGRLDCAGFDVAASTPIDPEVHEDIMAYGGFRWISAFHWRRALEHLTQDLVLHGGRAKCAAPAAAPAAAQEASLRVSGCIRAGKVLWFPALEHPAGSRPPAPGPHRLLALDADGFVLADLPFEAPEMPGHDVRFFEFAVPMTEALRTGLATFQVHLDGRALPLVASWTGKPLAPAGSGLGLGEPPPPVARRAADGTVTLAWDLGRHPQVLVLDPATGAELGTLQPRDRTLRTDATELDLRLSDGVCTTRVRVPVLPGA